MALPYITGPIAYAPVGVVPSPSTLWSENPASPIRAAHGPRTATQQGPWRAQAVRVARVVEYPAASTVMSSLAVSVAASRAARPGGQVLVAAGAATVAGPVVVVIASVVVVIDEVVIGDVVVVAAVDEDVAVGARRPPLVTAVAFAVAEAQPHRRSATADPTATTRRRHRATPLVGRRRCRGRGVMLSAVAAAALVACAATSGPHRPGGTSGSSPATVRGTSIVASASTVAST